MKNKYQEAFRWCAGHTSFNQFDKDEAQWAEETLHELVDKETPMKPINQYEIDFGLGNCGNCFKCASLVNYQMVYCSGCGQKLEWSEEDEK